MATMLRAGKSSLDEFLPEHLFAAGVRSGEREDRYQPALLSPGEVQLDPVESLGRPAAPASVQLWPMLAAGFVAVGVSLVAIAALGKFGQF